MLPFAKGTWGGEWHPDFAPQPGDIDVKEHWGSSGFARYRVIWEVSVTPDGEGVCLFANHVRVYATDHFASLLRERGVPFAAVAAGAQETVDEHNAEEAPLFAKNVEAKALASVWGAMSGI